jgi:hypothetical protein
MLEGTRYKGIISCSFSSFIWKLEKKNNPNNPVNPVYKKE